MHVADTGPAGSGDSATDGSASPGDAISGGDTHSDGTAVGPADSNPWRGDGCTTATVGMRCKYHADCGQGAFCQAVSKSVGLCSCECNPDDPNTPATDEDICPDGTRCVKLSIGTPAKMLGRCLRTCQPKLDSNACAEGVACHPRSGANVGVFGAAFCLYEGCKSGANCPVTTGTDCDLASKPCPSGQSCRPFTTTLMAGQCVVDGICDPVSGLCRPHDKGKAGAEVGAPCKGDVQCGPGMFCFAEVDTGKLLGGKGAACTDGKSCCSGVCYAGKCLAGACPVRYRNGYCSRQDCRFAGTLPHTACPTGSSCNILLPTGACQRLCAPDNASTCRGHPDDKLGDYECRAWNNISQGPTPFASGPVCDFGKTWTCSFFAGKGSHTCASLGLLPGNPTAMACRDLAGKKLTNPADAKGYCLDNTPSGPLE